MLGAAADGLAVAVVLIMWITTISLAFSRSTADGGIAITMAAVKVALLNFPGAR